ncbi:MAG TPA: CheR family methyltransferase [Dongiaceae bacterium]
MALQAVVSDETAIREIAAGSLAAPFGESRFFRDRAASDLLEQTIIPALLEGETPQDPLRAWVLGCGTGEDAYSVALLLGDATRKRGHTPQIQIFATDDDPQRLALARSGRYPASIDRDVPRPLLDRWLLKEADAYCVSRRLREACTFSIHDVTQDVPFSRLDLICCVDVLDALSLEMQNKVLQLFHFALRRGGYLLVGTASGADRHPGLFEPADGTARVFRRVEGTRQIWPDFPLAPNRAPVHAANVHSLREQHIVRLEAELRSTQVQLRSTVAELEIANRELQYSNEEYQSANEELRCTNDELEASKEELQCTNKELETVNGELAHRVADLANANTDLRNLFDSTRIATVFLGRDLRIKRFTPAMMEIYRLANSDVGRLITDIASDVPYESLRDDVDAVLRNFRPIERKLQDPITGARYLLRVLPYRGVDDAVAGAVLTFLDVTATARAEDALRGSEERFRMVATTVPAALFTTDAALDWDYVNPRFYESSGLREGDALGRGWLSAVHPDDREEVLRRLGACRGSGRIFEHEFRLSDMAMGYRWYLARATAMRNDEGAIVKWAGSLIDIHERRLAETRQRMLFAELQRRVKTVLGVVRSIAGHTVDSSATLHDFHVHFEGRLDALARTQTSLARHGGEGIDLEELVSEELLSNVPGEKEQISISGSAVRIGERAAEALGLAIHELATNASKYGALAHSSGRIAVSWETRDAVEGQWLDLHWVESTVPVINPNPKRTGFGREFLERGLPFELGGSTALEFRPGGLRFVLEMPLGVISAALMGGLT